MSWFRRKRAAPSTISDVGGEDVFQRMVTLGRSVDSSTRYTIFNSIAIAAQHDPKCPAEQRSFMINEVRRAFEVDGEKMPD